VADGWCWFIVRDKYCWLVASGWFVMREKYCWLVAHKPNQQGENPNSMHRHRDRSWKEIKLYFIWTCTWLLYVVWPLAAFALLNSEYQSHLCSFFLKGIIRIYVFLFIEQVFCYNVLWANLHCLYRLKTFAKEVALIRWSLVLASITN
jgi:hypothetical protein